MILLDRIHSILAGRATVIKTALIFFISVSCLYCSNQKVEKSAKELAIEKGLVWLSTLDADPLRLSARNLKGKKHFVEKLYAYYQVYLHEKCADKKRVLLRSMSVMLQCTNNPQYHKLPQDKKKFKEDIMPYIHACYIMEKLGLDTRAYRNMLSNYLPQIYDHMKPRNVTPKMMFITFLQNLGYPTPLQLDELIKRSKTAEMQEVAKYKIDGEKLITYMYDLCHEVFVFTNYGQKSLAAIIEPYRTYLMQTIPLLIERLLKEGDERHLDNLAELVVCLGYMDGGSSAAFEAGIDYILGHQNNDGSFGDYERARDYFLQRGINYDVDIKQYLHTTEVCLWALAVALHNEEKNSH
jgi:hypothetical protein